MLGTLDKHMYFWNWNVKCLLPFITRSYYRKENAADVLTNQELLFHVTIVLRARIFGSLVSVLNSCSGDGTFVT